MSATGTSSAGSCAALGWKSAVVLAAPPVFDNIVLELRTEALEGCGDIRRSAAPEPSRKACRAIYGRLPVTVLRRSVTFLRAEGRAGGTSAAFPITRGAERRRPTCSHGGSQPARPKCS